MIAVVTFGLFCGLDLEMSEPRAWLGKWERLQARAQPNER